MTAATIILVALLVLFLLVWKAVRGHGAGPGDLSRLNTRENEIDIDVLALLLSKEENEYLRKSLPDQEFRFIKRQRVSLAQKYLRAINRNTGQLIRAADAAIRSRDREVARAAHELLLMAFRVRLNMPIVHLCLLTEWLLPTLNLTPPKLKLYREMAGRLVFIFERLEATHSSMSSAG